MNKLEESNIKNKLIKKAKSWLTSEYDQKTRNEVQNLINNNSDELTESFYKNLEFGTGGLRGIMGVGTNRINVYTIAMTTQGLCNYLKLQFPDSNSLSIAIAFDSRNNSSLFARKTAEICSANGITAHLFDILRPTPELSFAVRELGCTSGIVITASHNPKEYNGYKVYWNDGGQIVAPHDKGIIEEVRKVTSMKEVNSLVNLDLIKPIGVDIDQKYLSKIKELTNPNTEKKNLKIVYTSLHGTGITMVPEALKNAGYNNIILVKQQEKPDGNFPTVASPNPEEASALQLAIETAEKTDADILFGTDPDADRVGLAFKNADGKFTLLNGNQAASLLIYYLIEKLKSKNELTKKHYVVKTIVTTTLIDEICIANNVDCYNTLTGFKFIAEKLREYEGTKIFIGGGEESYGYLVGDFVRDKDAIISTVMLCEVAQWAKNKGQNLQDLLTEIYLQFGFYKEYLISITKKGKSGAEEIAAMMTHFRTTPPKDLGGIKVAKIANYQNNIITNISDNSSTPTGLPSSNVIQFFLNDGSKITARPSGTEPKIKFYFSVKAQFKDTSNYIKTNAALDKKIKKIVNDLGV